ncbi:MAG TPA: CoA transferase, partial [Castellaniella sp.]|nr:CoA transferase [Castellaniella sp.]
LNTARIPAGRIYSVADIAADPHYRARGMILDQPLADGTPCQVPGIVPKLSATPGGVERRAPSLGQDTRDVLDELGVDAEIQARWRALGYI